MSVLVIYIVIILQHHIQLLLLFVIFCLASGTFLHHGVHYSIQMEVDKLLICR